MHNRSGKPVYVELSKAQISPMKNLVVSSCSKGGFTIAQQIEVDNEDDGTGINVFLKGAFHVSNLERLKDVRDAIDAAIDIASKDDGYIDDEDSIEWDEDEYE